MKHIFVRVFIYFGVVIVAFTLLIGLLFTQFNQNNIVGTYRSQLTDLSKSVADRVGKAQVTGDTKAFSDYLSAVEDFGSSRRMDIWIISNPKADHPLEEEYTNVGPDQMDMSDKMEGILSSAFDGKKKNYTDHDKIYDTDMMHVASPIYDADKQVIGAVVVNGPMRMRSNTVTQYQKYMILLRSESSRMKTTLLTPSMRSIPWPRDS